MGSVPLDRHLERMQYNAEPKTRFLYTGITIMGKFRGPNATSSDLSVLENTSGTMVPMGVSPLCA